MSSGEIFRNTALDARFKVIFMPNIVMATITEETVYLLNPATDEIVDCAISKYVAESPHTVTAGRKQIEVILTPVETLEKKTLYQVVASEDVLGFEGWGIILTRNGNIVICDGFERGDILPVVGQTIYISESPYVINEISGTWEDRDSVLTLILDRQVQGSGDIVKFGDIIKLTKGDKIYSIETAGIITEFYPEDGAANVEKTSEIALATSETMSLEAIKPSHIQLHHVKWIPEYIEDLSRLGNVDDTRAFDFGDERTIRWHEGHWADSAKESFHMVKYSEDDTYNLSEYNYTVDQWLEYNKNSWVKNFGNVNTVYYYRVHQQHKWNDESYVVRYVYVPVPEGDEAPEEPENWESLDWTGIDVNNLCPECEIVVRSTESKRFRTKENLELVPSGNILNKNLIDSVFYQLVIYKQELEHELKDGETMEIQSPEGEVRGRFTIVMAQNEIITIFASDPGSENITTGDKIYFVDPEFAECTTCEMVAGEYELQTELLYGEDEYRREPRLDWKGSAGPDGDNPYPTYSDLDVGPPWIRECGGNLQYYMRRYHENHNADGHGTGYHLVSYIHPDDDPEAFNPYKCQCCEWVNSYEVDRNFIKEGTVAGKRVRDLEFENNLEDFLFDSNYHYMPNIKAQFNYYEFRDDYSLEEWYWLVEKGLQQRKYPWKMNTTISYQDNLGSNSIPVTSGSQYLIKVQPMTDMDLNWEKAEQMQTDFQDPFLEDIPFPKILEPRNLLTGATYELFTSQDLESIEGIREGIDTVTRFSVTPIIRSISPEPDDLTVLSAELVVIELDGAVDLSTLTADTLKMYYKNTSVEVEDYIVDYNNDTITIAGNVIQVENMGKPDMSISGPTSQYYEVEFTEGTIRLLYSDEERCGDYFIEYVSDEDPLTREPRYRLYVYLCEDRNALTVETLPFLLGTGYNVKLAPELGLTDGRTLGYQNAWVFRTKQFIRWLSPVPDLENAPLACDVWIDFNYKLDLYDNIFFQNSIINENEVIGRTTDTSRVYVIAENDLLTLDSTPGKTSRTILEEHIGEYDLLKNFYKPGLITQINDTTVDESILWIQFETDYEPLSNYYIVLEPPIYTVDQGYTRDPLIFRFATNRFVRWTNPHAYMENVPLNSRMYVQFLHGVVEDTLDERGIYIDKMYPPPTDTDAGARYSGDVAYDEDSYRASFLANIGIDQTEKEKGKGKKTKENFSTLLSYPYNKDTRWLRLNVTPNVVDYQGETLNANFESPFTFHPIIRETVPNFGDREVYCILDEIEIYSNIGNLIHWDQVITDFPPGTFDPPRPDYRKTNGTGTLTEEATALIYLENMSSNEKIYFDKIRQECSNTVNGYIGGARIEAPSGSKQRTKLVCTLDDNEPIVLEPGQNYRLVISNDLLVNVGTETGGLPYPEEEVLVNLFNTDPPSIANNYGKAWESRFRTALIEETYPQAYEKGVTLDVQPWVKFAEPLDESTIVDSVYRIYKVPEIRKVLSSVSDTTAVVQIIEDELEIASKELYEGSLVGTMPLGTKFTFSSYLSEPFYVDSITDATTFTFSPELPEFVDPQEDDLIVFEPNKVKKQILSEYFQEGTLTRDYERGANVIHIKNNPARADERTYGITPKTLTDLDIKIGSWFKVISKKTFSNIYYITDIDGDGDTTTIEFWPRLEEKTEAYDTYGRLLDEVMYIEIYPQLHPQFPTLSKDIAIGDRLVETTGYLNYKYLPEKNQWISFIDYGLTDPQIVDQYLFRDGYAVAFQVSDITCERDGVEIESTEVVPTDTVILKLRMASNFDLSAGLEILLAPLDYRYFITGSMYLKNNLAEDEPFVSGKLSYDPDNYILTFIPDEDLDNSSIWIRNCDYDSLFHNYSIIITTEIKTITGASLLVPQEIPFKTWTYLQRVSPEDGEKSMPIFGTLKAFFKQNMVFNYGGPSPAGYARSFYDPEGVAYSNSNPFPFLPTGVGIVLDDRSYVSPSGSNWQMIVYQSPRFDEGIEIYDRIDDSEILPDTARAGEFGEFVNGRVGPVFNIIAGTPSLTWRRCERIASNNPPAAGENQYVYYTLEPDTLYKAVLRYRQLRPADTLEDQETGEDLSFDFINSIKCRFWEDKNYTWFFTTDKLVYNVLPEKNQEEVFADEPVKIIFIDEMDADTLLMETDFSNERVVPDTEAFREKNTVYIWRDSSITYRDEAGNILFVQEQRTQIPCTYLKYTTEDYPDRFVGFPGDNLGSVSDDFATIPVYLSTGKKHRLYKHSRTIVEITPKNEFKAGTTYYVSVNDKVKTKLSVGYAEGHEFISNFRTSDLIRKVSIETDVSADLVYEPGFPAYRPKYVKVMFHRHIDPESIGAEEDLLVHDSFSRISVYRLPVDTILSPPASPRAHVSYRDYGVYGPVPESGELTINEYCRNGGPTCETENDAAVNIWAEWRPFSPRVLEPSFNDSEIQIRIVLSSSIKSLPYTYNESTEDYRVEFNPDGDETIFSLPFGLQKTVTQRLKFTGDVLVENKLSMVYPAPQDYIQNNPTFDVYGVPRQFNQITIEYYGQLISSIGVLPYFWPISLLNEDDEMIESADFNFTSSGRDTMIMTIDQNQDRLLNTEIYKFLIWPKISFTDVPGVIDDEDSGGLALPLAPSDTDLVIYPEQTGLSDGYLLIDRNNGPDPLMLEIENISTEIWTQYGITSKVDEDTVTVSLIVWGSMLLLGTGTTIYFEKDERLYETEIDSLPFLTINFDPPISGFTTDGFEDHFFVEGVQAAGTDVDFTTADIVSRLNSQTGTIALGTDCYTNAYTVNYHINNLVEHVSLEWEEDRFVMWIVFFNSTGETKRPDFDDIQDWYDDGRIYIRRGDTTYNFVLPIAEFQRFSLGSDNVKVLKIKPEVSQAPGLRRPWDAWPFGGFSPDTPFELVINKQVASEDTTYICGRDVIAAGTVSGNYNANITIIEIDAGINPAPTVGKHIMINDWSYKIKEVTSLGGTDYSLTLESGLEQPVTTGTGANYDAANFYNADFIQRLICPSYPELETPPICKTSTEQGGCSKNDSGVYSMDPAPYSDNITITTPMPIVVTFTDAFYQFNKNFLKLYTVPEDLENFTGNEEDYEVRCTYEVDYENGVVTMTPVNSSNLPIPLIEDTEYFLVVKESIYNENLGQEYGLRLLVTVEGERDPDEDENWLENQAILIEDVVGQDFSQNYQALVTSAWSTPPPQGRRVRLLDENGVFKSYTIEYIEKVWVDAGSVLILHLLERVYSNHNIGAVIELEKDFGTDQIPVLITEQEVFSFTTGE